MFFNMDQHIADGCDRLRQNLKNIQGSSYYKGMDLPGTALSHKLQEYEYEYL